MNKFNDFFRRRHTGVLSDGMWSAHGRPTMGRPNGRTKQVS